MTKCNDSAANRSADRVIRAGRASAGRIEYQVLEYLKRGHTASETVQLMRNYHCTSVNPQWIKSLAGE